jgi:hypothetical protein
VNVPFGEFDYQNGIVTDVDHLYYNFDINLAVRYGITLFSLNYNKMEGVDKIEPIKFGSRLVKAGVGVNIGKHMPSFGFLINPPYRNSDQTDVIYGIEFKYEIGF